MFKRASALALAAAVLTAGCAASTKESSSGASSSTAGGTAKVTAAPTEPAGAGAAAGAAAAGAAAGAQLHKLANGLQYQDLVVGSGKMAETGMNVSVHYTGRLTDGTQFDSSLDRGQPLRFQLGAGTVIKGWEEGIKGMRIGGKRKLTVPPDMGYGATGNGPIPPNATLVFDIELLDVQ